MADTSSPGNLTDKAASARAPEAYGWLRWTIRITGILLMFGGTIYLGGTAWALLTDKKTGGGLLVVIMSLVVLGLGIYVLRIGLGMLRSINAHTIASFSFVFALIYTFILVHIVPSTSMFSDHPVLVGFVILLCFGLSYWILKSILFRLLLPREEQ
jgi:hypothetical protein